METKIKCNVISCFIASFIASFVAIFLAYLIKPCILDNCCGAVCCLIALILIVGVICFINNNKSKCINHPIVIGMSVISLIIAVATVIYLCCKGGCCGISNINYGDTSVTVLTTIIGLLVGWSIYSVIDTQSLIKKHEILKRKTTNEISKLHNLINDQEKEKEKLRNYVNTVQNFTMANIRMTENKYGDALGIYCIAAINLYEIVKIDENKTDDEQDLMDKSIRNAYNIVNEDKTIRGSQLLTNMHSDILKGLKEIRFKDVKTQEIVGIQIQTIITAIEKDYPQTEEPQSK